MSNAVGIKEFDGPARDPESQFQIGDRVLYLPEGIYSTITGYHWIVDCDAQQPPMIDHYELSCGIAVDGRLIAKAEPSR